MSGIIGGAGSKSGVIGTTELDYEEGSFTPVMAWGSGGQCNGSGQYTKIGNVVHIRCHLGDLGSSGASSGTVTTSGLPFASAEPTGLSWTQLYRIDLQDYQFYVHTSGTAFGLTFAADDGTGSGATETTFNYSSATIGFAGSYRV